MKNITYLLGLLLVLGVIASCTKDEDENPFASVEPRGAVVSTSNVQTGFFNLLDPSSSSISFDINTQGEAVNSVVVMQSTKGSTPIEVATVSSFPATISVSFADVMAASGVALEDLAPGDQTVFTFANVGTASGTYPSGASLSIPMACPSDLGGTYTSTATGTSTDDCCPDVTTVEGEVTLTDLGGGVYTISDWSGGLYFEWYAVYGITGPSDTEGTVQDVCNELSLTGPASEPFGTAITSSMTLADDGTITLTWSNGYDDQGVTTLTPQ